MKTKLTTILLLIIILAPLMPQETIAQGDNGQFAKITSQLRSPSLTTTAQRIAKAAECLIGKPYVAGTLDNGTQETITINLDKFDCVTFQETCIALARESQEPNPTYQHLHQQIENIRYRNGQNTGYQSRLHYSTDWILDNTRRGNFRNITKQLGGIPMTGTINYMSTHAEKYKALTANPALIDSMRTREQYLTKNHTYYIPKAKVNSIAGKIQTGSLIFITSATQSLGYGHVGIAIQEGGTLKMIHASSTAKKVTKTTGSLSDYLMGIPKTTGITILEPQ